MSVFGLKYINKRLLLTLLNDKNIYHDDKNRDNH